SFALCPLSLHDALPVFGADAPLLLRPGNSRQPQLRHLVEEGPVEFLLLVPLRGGGSHFLFRELPDHFPHHFMFFAQSKLHGHRSRQRFSRKIPGPGGAGRTFPPLPRSFIRRDRKSTRLNSSHVKISYAVFCLKKKKYYI